MVEFYGVWTYAWILDWFIGYYTGFLEFGLIYNWELVQKYDPIVTLKGGSNIEIDEPIGFIEEGIRIKMSEPIRLLKEGSTIKPSYPRRSSREEIIINQNVKIEELEGLD